VDLFVEKYEPGWIRDLWQSDAAVERSLEFFERLSCDISE